MLYVIVDSTENISPMLVQAKDADEINLRLKLSETQGIFGQVTDDELSALSGSAFTVVTA